MNKIKFLLGDKLTEIDFSKDTSLNTNTTLLNYLRSLPTRKSVKEGCAEGDCGACTVVLGELDNENKLIYKAYNSCLIFLPVIHGKQIITAEDLADNQTLHPVQQAMVDLDGSQCGFCTPGFVMSIFGIYKNFENPNDNQILDALTGNLCRCTGYRPIIDAAKKSYTYGTSDKFDTNKIQTQNILKQISDEFSELEIKTGNYKYFLPTTLKKALELIVKFPQATVINGSTDIALKVTKRKEDIFEIIDISSIKDLKLITETEKEYIIGSGVTLEQLKQFSIGKMQALNNMLSVFGSKQIRNKATIGGNVGTASPIGDISMTLLVYNSKVVVGEPERMIPLNEFIIGYRKISLNNNELIKSIIIPKFEDNSIIKSYKISKRKDLDISTVSAAFNLMLNNDNTVKQIYIAFGGMSAMTKRVTKIEDFLKGKIWNEETINEAKKLIDEEFTPISDARSSAEARKIMAKNLLTKFWSETL
jgi:xanthine dehydrogenase small subunit